MRRARRGWVVPGRVPTAEPGGVTGGPRGGRVTASGVTAFSTRAPKGGHGPGAGAPASSVRELKGTIAHEFVAFGDISAQDFRKLKIQKWLTPRRGLVLATEVS